MSDICSKITWGEWESGWGHGAGVLSLELASDSPGGLVKLQIRIPPSEFLIQPWV